MLLIKLMFFPVDARIGDAESNQFCNLCSLEARCQLEAIATLCILMKQV